MSRLYRPKGKPISLLSRGLTAALLIIAAAPRAHALRQRTYANPIDIDYRYNFEQLNQGISYRSGADQGTTIELRALTVGQGYWVAIESFDENGVSTLSPAVPIR